MSIYNQNKQSFNVYYALHAMLFNPKNTKHYICYDDFSD